MKRKPGEYEEKDKKVKYSHEDGIEPCDWGFATKAIHAGQPPDPISGAVNIPISLATTFVQKSPGVHQGFEYSRSGNPTRKAFEELIATLEGAKYGLAFSSGLATLATIVNMLEKDDHVICGDDVYGGTNRYLNKVAKPMGINSTLVDMSSLDKVKASFTEKTKLLWLETPTNPTLKIFDIKALSEMAHQHGAMVVVDNTFMTPFFQQPLKLGADIVVHSVTKYLGGHSDVVMGVLAMSDEKKYEKMKFLQNAIGAVPSPFDCYMAMRGVKTLPIRMQAHEKNAQAVAAFLEGHAKVDKVIYPGLKSHPEYALAKQQMSGFGGMITFFLKGGLKESRTFLESLKIFALAESLGAVESLAEHPAIMTHASVPPAQRKELGISDSLIRLSVGIEDLDDLLKDLRQALDAVELA